MLEIIAIIFLARSNGKKALENGRNPTVFNLLTWLFWFGFEFTGAFLAAFATRGEAGFGIYYIAALVAAVIGGFTPRLILAMIGTGNYRTSAEKATQKALEFSRALNTPAQIVLTNLMSNTQGYSYYFYNIGKPLAVIPSNNQSVLTVEQSVNIISVSYGNTETAPLILNLNDGETAEVVLEKGRLYRKNYKW
jgi:hypothetical protein